MSLPSHIKVIVFDAYGTLLNVRAIEEGLEIYFKEKAVAISEVWRKKQLEYTWLRTMMGQYLPFSSVTREALDFACLQNKVELSNAIEKDLIDRYYQLSAFPEVPNLLEKLSQKYRLAILSNADPEMLMGAVKFNKLESSLEAVLSADSVQKFKPRPEVYEITTSHFGLKGEDIAFISSNTWDVAGASSYGLYAIRLKRNSLPMDTIGFQPTQTLESLSQLV